jgi:hypothetical protein
MKYTLLHSSTFTPQDISGALAAEGVDVQPLASPGDLAVAGVPTALILDP